MRGDPDENSLAVDLDQAKLLTATDVLFCDRLNRAGMMAALCVTLQVKSERRTTGEQNKHYCVTKWRELPARGDSLVV